MRSSLADLLQRDPYQAYTYSYPHKTSYRTLTPTIALRDAWASEDRSALFLYLHVPFCEQRCGFCNLFTQAQPQGEVVERYLATLERQAEITAAALAPARFARLAIGGGTPTFLSPAQLTRLLAIPSRLGARGIPGSVEVSPATADAERIAILRAAGVTRVSMGVQSFLRSETAAVSRHQDPQAVLAACARIATARFPVFNLDLIYGIPGQTVASLTESLTTAIAAGANELYLYPLYVRPLTTMGKRRVGDALDRIDLYRAARAFLLERGWRQASMRMFQAPTQGVQTGPTYRCQDDGMIGLGAGARSYTRSLHYASEYAVEQGRVRSLVAEWSAQDDQALRTIRHGIHLDGEDQRRRFVILSLLERGLDVAAYRQRFASSVDNDLPELDELQPLGLATRDERLLHLTDEGLERSDLIGQWLYSVRVRERMASYVAH
jgi:oxygen-independent coproporphyrinogen-3 oxidase